MTLSYIALYYIYMSSYSTNYMMIAVFIYYYHDYIIRCKYNVGTLFKLDIILLTIMDINSFV